MARTVRCWQRFEVVDENGRSVVAPMGRRLSSVPVTIAAATGATHDQSHSVAASGIVKLWDIADDTADADAILFEADQDGLIEFVNNSAANFFELETKANVPMIVAGDAGQHSGTVGLFDGTSDDLERVYWKNTSSSTAIARIVVVT